MSAHAHLIPSIAALVMPPAYPAPSPAGYIFIEPSARFVSLSRNILIGALVLVSAPVRTAVFDAKPLILLSKESIAPLIP